MSFRLSRWTILCGVLVALAVCCTSRAVADTIGLDSTPTSEKKYQEVEDAFAKFKDRDIDGAMKLLDDAVKKHPELPPSQIILAQFFAAANSLPGMRGALEQAVLKVPTDPEAYIIFAEFALREGRITEADLLLSKARTLLETFKGDAKRKDNMQGRMLNGLSQVAIARADWAGAKKLLEEWLKLAPKDANVMQRLARVLFMLKEPQAAYAMLQDAKKADSSVLQPEAQMAQLYAGMGDSDPKVVEKNLETAKKYINMALKAADKKDIKVPLVAGQFFLETGNLDQAKEQAAAALAIDDKSIEAQLFRGIVALFQKDYKGAELHFEQAVLKAPNNFAATNNLALALVEQRDEAKNRRALAYAENNAKLYPKSAEAASTYGWVLYKNGRLNEAEQALNAAASAGNISSDTAYYLARVSADRGNKDVARNLLKAALASKRPFSQRDEAEKLLDKLGTK